MMCICVYVNYMYIYWRQKLLYPWSVARDCALAPSSPVFGYVEVLSFLRCLSRKVFQNHCCSALVSSLRLLHLLASVLAIFVDIQLLASSTNKPHMYQLSAQRGNLAALHHVPTAAPCCLVRLCMMIANSGSSIRFSLLVICLMIQAVNGSLRKACPIFWNQPVLLFPVKVSVFLGQLLTDSGGEGRRVVPAEGEPCLHELHVNMRYWDDLTKRRFHSWALLLVMQRLLPLPPSCLHRGCSCCHCVQLLWAHLQTILSCLLLVARVNVLEGSHWNRHFASYRSAFRGTVDLCLCCLSLSLSISPLGLGRNGSDSLRHVLTYLSKLACIQVSKR